MSNNTPHRDGAGLLTVPQAVWGSFAADRGSAAALVPLPRYALARLDAYMAVAAS